MNPVPVPRGLRRLLGLLRDFHDQQVELAERRRLLNRPWEEEFLHWGPDGSLHGHLAPPGRRRFGTTSSGWCLALAGNL
ncbi:MAG TPA: hypothetical protein VFG87_27160 [Amycolatopsis sp.]|nr:hypothetical protein [Amycolatopsis sp.]